MQLSVVSSPCDNIIHSLVNTSDYSGSFLPGFTMTDDDSAGEEEDLLADIDHVTYVCREGESLKILAFYKVGTAFPEQSDIFQNKFVSMLSPAMESTGLWPLLKDSY